MLYPKQGPKFFSELANAKKMILNDLIERELVLGEFEEKGYMMRDDHIETAINYHILTRFNGNRDAFLKGLQAAGQGDGFPRVDQEAGDRECDAQQPVRPQYSSYAG